MEHVFKPDKKYFTKVLWIQLATTVFTSVAASVIHLIVRLAGGKPEALLAIWIICIGPLLLMWIIATPIAFYWIKSLEYQIHDDRLKINQGIITKTQKNIPFRAITDFIMERTLFDRILGIGAVKVQTAGQSMQPSGYEGKLGGLIEYEKWHSILNEKVKSLHPLSESVTVAEPRQKSEKEILVKILDELKEIKKNTAKKQ